MEIGSIYETIELELIRMTIIYPLLKSLNAESNVTTKFNVRALRESSIGSGSNFHYCIDTHACNLSQFRITAAVSRVRLFQIQAPISSHSVRR